MRGRTALERTERAAVRDKRARDQGGNRPAGHESPGGGRRSGATIKVDDAIRDPEPMTEDQKLLDTLPVTARVTSPSASRPSTSSLVIRSTRQLSLRRKSVCAEAGSVSSSF